MAIWNHESKLGAWLEIKTWEVALHRGVLYEQQIPYAGFKYPQKRDIT